MDLLDLATYMNDVGNYFILVPIGLGLYYFRTISRVQKVLLVGLGVMLLQLLLFLLIAVKSAFIYSYLGAILEVMIFLTILSLTDKQAAVRTPGMWLGGLVLLCIPIDAVGISGMDHFGISTFFARCYLFGLGLVLLTRLFKTNLDSPVLKSPFAWICIGVIVNNYVGSFNIFSLEIMTTSQSLVLQFYMVWAMARVLMYLAFSYSFYLSGQKNG